METERTIEQRLKHCAILKSYENQTFQLANSELMKIYSDMTAQTPEEVMDAVTQMWPRYNERLGEIFARRDKEIADFNEECDREDLANAAAERAKPGAATIVECQETMRRLGEAMKGLGCQKRLIEEKQPEPSDDVLTEEKVYDYNQERSVKAGERANQLAWMFIVMMTGGLISGNVFKTFAVCAALAAAYMLLSVAQAVWQTFTSWLFKQQIKKMDVAPDDYPSWVGGGAWLFFWAKMISIASAVIYFVKAIFF